MADVNLEPYIELRKKQDPEKEQEFFCHCQQVMSDIKQQDFYSRIRYVLIIRHETQSCS